MAAVRGVPSTDQLNRAMLVGRQIDLRGRREMVRDAYKSLGRKSLPTVDAFFIVYADEETLECMTVQGTVVMIAVDVLRAADVPVIATVASVKDCLELDKHLFNRIFGDMVNGLMIDGFAVASKFTYILRKAEVGRICRRAACFSRIPPEVTKPGVRV